MIGQIINYRYEILEKAGDGTLYSVYKARDKVLNRLVAIKVLSSLAAENKDFAERTVAETQAVQDLVHPNIARVFEADSHDGTYFTAVEYVRGINLKDRIRRTAPFTISYAVDIAIAVAEALDYAHKRGIVHGDVRPHNILTSSDGQVKLTDFGVHAAVAASPTVKDNTMLRSVHYGAPEVLKGTFPQPYSDIYSLGVVIYEMITGGVPFDGDCTIAIAAKHFDEPPPLPNVINPGVPKLLNEIVLKAMAKNPQDRYESMGAMLRDLYAVREALRVGPQPRPQPEPARPAAPTVPGPLPVEEPPMLEESSLRSTVLILLGVFVGVMAIGVASAYFFLVKLPTQVRVPDFTGMTITQAQSAAQSKGIILEQYREEYNDHYEEGQIYFTEPRPGGSVLKDSPVVKAWISKGARFVKVPSVIGLRQEVATERIGGSRLVPRVKYEYHDSVEVGYVINQDPEAGTSLEPLKLVTISVSKGAQAPPVTSRPETGDETTVGGEAAPVPLGEERQIDVSVEVPGEGDETRVVRILVTDSQGSDHVAYDQVHYGGDRFTEPVRAYGDSIEIKCQIDGKVVWSKTFNR